MLSRFIGRSKAREVNTNPAKIRDILTRGVEDVFVQESLEQKLKSGKQLRVKFGIDPTGPKIHLGRAIPLRKLKAFQDLGHHVILLVGDFTAQIGDPSDKIEKRPMLTSEKIKENMRDYKAILGKVIDISKTEIVYNSAWLSKLGFAEICQLAESFTVQQMSNRRNFKDRFDKNEEVSLREFMYPLMQGYDSVALKADVELGGFDQLFNLKAGRVIQKHYGQPEQDVLTTQMLEGTDGRKMSTSWGNVITITDEPNDMFGKIMSVRDELITKYFLLCTEESEDKIRALEEGMKGGTVNPRDAKAELGKKIVALYHGEDKARLAEENFINTFKKGGVSEDAKEVYVKSGAVLVDVLLLENLVESKTEWRRLVLGGAVTVVATGEKITNDKVTVTAEMDLKIGKQRFIKLRLL